MPVQKEKAPDGGRGNFSRSRAPRTDKHFHEIRGKNTKMTCHAGV